MCILQDGLGDTIRVSLTEAPEQEIDPCTKLANLGMKISAEQKGVVSQQVCMYLNHLSEKLDAMKFFGSSQSFIFYALNPHFEAQVFFIYAKWVVDYFHFNRNVKMPF
jgi:hypothetical protein